MRRRGVWLDEVVYDCGVSIRLGFILTLPTLKSGDRVAVKAREIVGIIFL